MQKKKEKHIKVHIQYKRHVNTKEFRHILICNLIRILLSLVAKQKL